ncbi:hypothetical protein EGD00_08395 [Pectobacterium carotovorum subsp. carotovorum]|nr:hypothetical protein EGD00_08395 [Pectobacterium carotovorum subsp. carotovorum]
MTMIEIGSHISSNRIGYSHHGIYIGNHHVIHYSGLSNGLSKGNICKTTLDDFLNDEPEFSIIIHKNCKFKPIEIVARAFTRIGEDKYNLFTNNCEHFATWCITGNSRSAQVERRIKQVRAASKTYMAYKIISINKASPTILRTTTAIPKMTQPIEKYISSSVANSLARNAITQSITSSSASVAFAGSNIAGVVSGSATLVGGLQQQVEVRQ